MSRTQKRKQCHLQYDLKHLLLDYFLHQRDLDIYHSYYDLELYTSPDYRGHFSSKNRSGERFGYIYILYMMIIIIIYCIIRETRVIKY